MARVLLILPSQTYRATDFLDAARALSLDVVVASERNQVLAEQMGDSFLLVDLGEPDAAARRIVDAARAGSFDAIVPVDDGGVLPAALAAAELGLPHNPPDAVAVTRNKAMLRRRISRAGLPQPRFEVLGPNENAAAILDLLGPPVVVKPLSLSMSRGVIRADTAAEATAAVERIRHILTVSGHNPNGPLLMERFVPGAEVALEGVLVAGRLDILAVLDKPDPLDGPYFEETIYVTPSRHHPEVLDEVSRLAAAATEAVGLVEGPIHAEFRITRGQVVFLELAARPIGGLCGRALRFGLLGSSLETVLLRSALRMPTSGLQREAAAAGVMMLPIPGAGRLAAVGGQEAARRVPLITDLAITVPTGSTIRPLPDGDRYLGFVFARGPDPASVETALRRAHSALDVQIAQGDDAEDGAGASGCT